MEQESEPEPGVTVIADPARPGRVWVRLDDQGITYRNSGRRIEQIGWKQVRCLTAGAPWQEFLGLRIVLRDERVIRPKATRRSPSAALAAVRQAAARHKVPVIASAGVRQGPPDQAGLYVDPGGKPALREWTGTQWSPFLQVDPASAAAGGDRGSATVWSPLSGPDQQQEWEAARGRVREWAVGTAVLTGITAAAIAAMVLKSGNAWAGIAVALAVWCTSGCWWIFFERKQVNQAARRAAQLASAQRNPLAPAGNRDGRPPKATTSQSPAAGPAAAAVRVSCAECGADSTRATGACARCGAPLLPLAGLNE
jgi:hypothetical protein